MTCALEAGKAYAETATEAAKLKCPSSEETVKAITADTKKIRGCLQALTGAAPGGACSDLLGRWERVVNAICTCTTMDCAKKLFGTLAMMARSCKSFQPTPDQKNRLLSMTRRMETCVEALKKAPPTK